MAEPNVAPLRARRKLLGAVPETNSGTFPTITTAFAANIFNIACKPGNFFQESNERTPNGNYEGTLPGVVGQQTGELSFDVEICPGDSSLSLLTGCGWKLDTGVYVPTSDVAARKTWGFKVWESGKYKKIIGAVASSARFKCTVGARLMLSMTWMGIWGGEFAEAMPSDPTFGTPYVCMGSTFTIGAAAHPHTREIGVDLGIAGEPRDSLAATTGIHHFLNGKRRPKLTLDPESRLVASYDHYGLLLAGATTAFSMAFTSGATTLTIAAPAAQRTTIAGAARGEYSTENVEMECRADAGDDELTFAEAA